MIFSISVYVLCIGYAVTALQRLPNEIMQDLPKEIKEKLDLLNCYESPPSRAHGEWECRYTTFRNKSKRICHINCIEGYKASGSFMSCFGNNTWEQDYVEYPSKCEPNVLDTNECSKPELNQCSHFCHNTPGSYKCSCPPGYWLHTGTKCFDIDECSREKSNPCSHNCHNTPGGYFCSCREGYWLIQGGICEGCPRNSYKINDGTDCLSCPPNSYTISEGKTTINDCLCHLGFKRDASDTSQNILCTDIDECQVENFGCSHACVNTPGSAHCSCPIGFQLREDNKTCTDIDECIFTNGGCEGSCHNTIGSFSCSCPSGYTAQETNPYSCVDIDECSVNNGICGQNCVNFPGGYYCSCDNGYRLDNSGKNCKRIVCPTLSIPRDVLVLCKFPDGTRIYRGNAVKDAEVYYENYTCLFRCKKGFKANVSFPNMKCVDGQWKGTIPQCIASPCPPFPNPANGKVLPVSCTSGTATAKQRCVVSCNPGYQLKGRKIYVCKNDLQWRSDEIPICESVMPPHITCHQDVIHELPIGNSSVWLTVPPPTANVEYRILEPEWIKMEELTVFTAGKTDVKFIAISPNADGKIDTCITSINIIDKEPPVITGCPAPIDVVTDTNGAVVTWEEPVVIDNVGVLMITKTQKPNTMLMPGKHIVEYIAIDEAGNSARCTFHISVKRTTCGDPIGPLNGEVSCYQMFVGKICEPVCNPGYMRHPDDYEIYACTPDGLWKPTNYISDCLEYHPQPTTGCPEFFESRTVNETGETICMKCPSSWKWSPDSHRCENPSLAISEDLSLATSEKQSLAIRENSSLAVKEDSPETFATESDW